jgi:phosphate transport system substrate-binding protein
MKKLMVLSIALTGLITSASAQRLKGSDTLLPLVQKESEEYLNTHRGADITVTGGGSGVGIAALMEGTTDIAMVSRKMKFDERLKLKESGKTVVETIVAYDALAVFVNPANKVTNLTRQQLEDIFTGKITNWKELGGDNLKIVVYSRETSSGTYEFFKTEILKNKNYMPSILSMPATGAVIQSVSQTKGAIGYVGLAYLNAGVKAIHISYDGKTYVAPTFERAKDKSYPVVRPLFFYHIKAKELVVKPFIDYMLSVKGQATVKAVGYIPVK